MWHKTHQTVISLVNVACLAFIIFIWTSANAEVDKVEGQPNFNIPTGPSFQSSLENLQTDWPRSRGQEQPNIFGLGKLLNKVGLKTKPHVPNGFFGSDLFLTGSPLLTLRGVRPQGDTLSQIAEVNGFQDKKELIRYLILAANADFLETLGLSETEAQEFLSSAFKFEELAESETHGQMAALMYKDVRRQIEDSVSEDVEETISSEVANTVVASVDYVVSQTVERNVEQLVETNIEETIEDRVLEVGDFHEYLNQYVDQRMYDYIQEHPELNSLGFSYTVRASDNQIIGHEVWDCGACVNNGDPNFVSNKRD